MHGDYRLDNLPFAPPAPRLAGMVDWRTCGYGRAVHDVAYFVCAGTMADRHALDLKAPDLLAG